MSNRRRTDRRVSAMRRRLSPDQLGAIGSGGPADMAIVRVNYVLNGPCFAWLAEVERQRASHFLAGWGLLAEDAVPDEALAGVILGVRAKLRHWADSAPTA